MAVTSPAFAQEATTPQAAPTQAIEEVVVTGSRIGRRDYVASSPITTVQPQLLQNNSSPTLDTALNQLPQFGVASQQIGTGPGGNAGRATLNLRNLGTNRNLVLMDGKRVVPSQSDFSVDINNIPGLVVDSVEVISGGASAVYGSDALSGVVNFKIKHRFSGVMVDGQYGRSERGDYGNYQLGGIAGSNFADNRGNAFVSIDYTQRDPVFYRDRPFYQKAFTQGVGAYAYPFIGFGYFKPNAANAPSQAAVNSYFSSVSPSYTAGSINAGASNLAFNNDGLSLFNANGKTVYDFLGSPNLRHAQGPGGVVYNVFDDATLSVALKRWSMFARSEYSVNDHISAFGEVMYNNTQTQNQGLDPLTDNYWSPTIPYDATHPVPTSLAGILNSRPNPTASWAYGGSASYAGPVHTQETSNVFQVLAGLKGDVPSTSLQWELTAQHGESRVTDETQGGMIFTRLQNLLAAPWYGQGFVSPEFGTVACTSGIYPFGQLNSPIQTNNPGAGSITLAGHTFSRTVSQDCLNYLTAHTTNLTTLKQDVIEGNLQGTVTTLPAGPMKFAAGFDYRLNSYGFAPDSLYTPLASSAAPLVNNFGVYASTGSTGVYEGYAELLVPVVKDLPFVRSLDTDLAARYSDYQQAGGVWAYKADFTWHVNEPFSLRGGYQRAVRAPNVNELFSAINPGNSSSGPTATDPCVAGVALAYGNNAALNPNTAKVQQLCSALLQKYGAAYDGASYIGAGAGFNFLVGSYQGNPALKPETADTFTLGGVFQSPWSLPFNSKFTVAVDYYNIAVHGAIGFLTPAQSYQLCFNQDGASNPTYSAASTYCSTIVRAPGNGFPSNVANTYANLGGILTDGVDTQVDWSSYIGPGRFAVNSVITYSANYKAQATPSGAYIQYEGTTNAQAQTYYRWRANNDFSYAVGSGTLGFRWHFYDALNDASYITNPKTTIKGVPTYSSFDLYGSYKLPHGMVLRAGIDNLLDTQPPAEGVGPTGAFTGTTLNQYYDVLGRRFYVGIRATF